MDFYYCSFRQIKMKKDVLMSMFCMRFFLQHYSETYKSFEAFLSDALNQEIIFSQKELGKGTPFFKLNDAVTKKYSQSEIADFIKAYCDKTADDRFTVKKKYVNDEYLYSVLYYCFINSYQITLDDYEGKYFITQKASL